MSEASKLLKKYFICVFITIITTLLVCSVFIAEFNTDAMLFG